jgi:UDP-N-acetyl-D-mannosaminuronate dehydrogenase
VLNYSFLQGRFSKHTLIKQIKTTYETHNQKVAVIGSGIMGSEIACHFANIGVEVLLLDIVPKKRLTAETKEVDIREQTVRNRLVNEHLGKLTLSCYSQNLLIVSRQVIRRDMAKYYC